MADIDVTSRIERLEVFEERLGVTLESLSAFVEDDAPYYLKVYGELHTRNGTELQGSVDLVVAAYDTSGRIIGTSSHWYSADDFFGLETFEFTVALPLSQVSKVRIYPKKG
jgi:hypothetical protein